MIEILAVRRTPPGSSNTIARVDFELSNGVRLYNVALKDTASGYRVFAPSAFGCATATFTRELAAELITAAITALGETNRNERCAA